MTASAHTLTEPRRDPAARIGALDAWESRCSCGLVLRSSLLGMLLTDCAEHRRYNLRHTVVGSIDRLGYLFCAVCRPANSDHPRAVFGDSGPHANEPCDVCGSILLDTATNEGTI